MTNAARRVPYDEFSFFGENIAEYSLDASAKPRVSRINHALEDGRHVSALQWGSTPAKIVFVHGSAQNAH
ncbi:MAG: alpha/beta hydrolase, partial [Actinomycetota bacterium]